MKKLLIGLGVLAVLAVAAIVAAPFLIPVDLVRGRIAAAVQAATGRELRIAGPVHARLFPTLAVTVGDVSLANAPWGSAPALARFKSLEVDLRLAPLLQGRAEIARLVLVGPEIDLEIGKDGRGNWVFSSTDPATGAAAGPAAGGPAGAGPADIRLEDVRIEDGRIGLIDHRDGSRQTIEHVALRLSLPSLDSSLAADGSGVWNGEAMRLHLGAARPRALLGGGDSAVDLKLDGKLLALAYTGTLHGLPPASSDGSIDVSAISLRRLLAWGGLAVAPAGETLGAFALKAKLSHAGSETTFRDASIALDAIRASGTLGLTTGRARPLLKGQLAVGVLDLNPYLPAQARAQTPAQAQPPAAGTPAGGAEGWSDAPFDLAGLRTADAALDLRADSILYRKLRLDRPQLGLTLTAGKLHVDIRQLGLSGGQGRMRLDLDASGAVPAIDLTANLAGTDVAKLLAATMGVERLSGTGTLDLAVRGRGGSQRALVASIDGKGAVNVANAEIKGVNLIGVAQNALTRATGGQSGTAATDLGTVTFVIARGVLRNDDLAARSGPVTATGAGTVDLPARTLDYRLVPQLTPTIKVPVLISGPWDRPSYLPDPTEALKAIGQQPGKAVDQFKQLAPGGGSNPADLLRGLLPRP